MYHVPQMELVTLLLLLAARLAHNEIAVRIALTVGFVGTTWLLFACIRDLAHMSSDDGLLYVARGWH